MADTHVHKDTVTTTEHLNFDKEKSLGEVDSNTSPVPYGEHTKDDHEDPILTQFTEKEQKRIVRKIDVRLISICGLLYCVSLLDRTNLSNANIAGLSADLELTVGERYSLVTLVFFITYVIFQPPATVLTRKLGPRIFLSGITFCWGIIMIGFGFVKNWQSLLGLRIVLGIFEAGLFPGVVYLLSTWYSRYDMGKRYAVFYFIGSMAAALGGILAYGLMQMAGTGGYNGWSWIFIIEGVITIGVAILGFIFMLAFPDTTNARSLRFLKPDELRWVLARVQRDRSDAELESFTLKRFFTGAADVQVWGFAFAFGAATTCSYALAFFLPVILVYNMGFEVGVAQCLVAPLYGFAGLQMITLSYFSDKYRQRGLPIAFNSIVCIIGLSIMGWHDTSGVRYFGAFFATAGANANVPAILTYQGNNIRGQWKRAFCSASLVGFGGIGGIVGSTVFRQKDFPNYVPGVSTTIGANVLILAIVGSLSIYYTIQNRRADRGQTVIAGIPGFRYTL